MAIALKDIGDGTPYHWCDPALGNVHENNTTIYNVDNRDEYTDMDGYKWTWEAGGTTDNTVKANQQTTYPAFYAAGHYDPGVPVSGTLVGKKWYLAGVGEWATYIYQRLGFTKNINDAISNLSYGILLEEALTKVGGKILDTTGTEPGKGYLMSTQVKYGSDKPLTIDQRYYYKWRGFGRGYGGISRGRIRPFIKY